MKPHPSKMRLLFSKIFIEMKNKTIQALFILSLFVTVLNSCTLTKEKNTPYVIVLSMDAFRWDYPDMYNTPTLDSIALLGVKAVSLKPCFPSKTFPNHYSMATGLYPDHHGIVQNSFYDPELNKHYSIGDRDAVYNPEFYGGEPIWVTAEKQGIISASYFWVGSETPHDGILPSYWKKYDHNFPFEQRIDSVISWLQLPEEKRPHLIMWYMNEPDDVGHYAGPNSTKTATKIQYLDSLIGVFIKKINQLPIANEINLIFTADHGMSNISDKRNIVLNDYIPEEWVNEVEGSNPSYNIDIKTEYEVEAFAILSNVEHLKIWKHGELPERLHYGTNPRTLDFTLVSDSSWSVHWKRRNFTYKGAHGFDNDNKDMHAIFYGIGPAFKVNHTHPSFSNINLYSIFANILMLDPAKTDGDLKNVIEMLKDE